MSENTNDSPRISFSNDFCHSDSIPIEQRPLESPLDFSNFYWGFPFEFSVPGNVKSGESSWSAEEFFNEGKILPTEMKKIQEPTKNYKTGLPKPEINPTEEFEIEEIGDKEEEEKLPLLRYNSTGSKQSETMKLQTWSSSSSLKNIFQRPPLKKNHGGYSYRGNGGGNRVSSILDVVPSRNLFGLGSINSSGGREKIKKRSMFFFIGKNDLSWRSVNQCFVYSLKL